MVLWVKYCLGDKHNYNLFTIWICLHLLNNYSHKYNHDNRIWFLIWFSKYCNEHITWNLVQFLFSSLNTINPHKCTNIFTQKYMSTHTYIQYSPILYVIAEGESAPGVLLFSHQLSNTMAPEPLAYHIFSWNYVWS